MDFRRPTGISRSKTAVIYLVTVPILAYPMNNSPYFIFYTDASQNGISAVLSQVKNKKEMVISYYSNILWKAKNNSRNFVLFASSSYFSRNRRNFSIFLAHPLFFFLLFSSFFFSFVSDPIYFFLMFSRFFIS